MMPVRAVSLACLSKFLSQGDIFVYRDFDEKQARVFHQCPKAPLSPADVDPFLQRHTVAYVFKQRYPESTWCQAIRKHKYHECQCVLRERVVSGGVPHMLLNPTSDLPIHDLGVSKWI